jgi:hypothetical protein
MKNLICLLFLACSSLPTAEDATKIIEEAGGFPEGVAVQIDDVTTVIFRDGKESGKLGECLLLPGGKREVTIYVARHPDVETLRQTILHELDHAVKTCSNEDHENSPKPN